MSFESPLRQGLRYFPMTLVLMAICVAVFLLQLLMGVNVANPTNQALLNWGANFLPYSIDDAPWRMVSSLFLHIGLLHLMFNMFALYYFGQVAERMFGSVNLLLLFLLSGIAGNILNNIYGWYQLMQGIPPAISAGASGGIMGIGMALLTVALSKTNLKQIQLNYQSLLMVMGINLVYGFLVSGIDNAGHIGGAITGMLLAIAYVLQYRTNHQRLLFDGSTMPHNPNWHHSKMPAQQPNRSTYFFKYQMTSGTIVTISYIVMSLLFVLISWWLHTAFINFVVGTSSGLIN